MQLNGLIQNEQNTEISKHFTKSAEYTRTTSGTIFSTGVRLSGGQVFFSIQTWCIPLEAFASKNNPTTDFCQLQNDIVINQPRF